MGTYRDEHAALDDATIARIYENTTKDITGAVHQLQDLDQNGAMFNSLLPLRGDAFRVVRGGVGATPQENFAALAQAYEVAQTLTPYGQPISADNRVTIILMPGIYSGNLVVGEEFIDFAGAGAGPEDVILQITNGQALVKSANDVKFFNLSISGEGSEDYGLIQRMGIYTDEVFRQVNFNSPNPWATGALCAGTYLDCVSNSDISFGGQDVDGNSITNLGLFINCRSSGGSSFFSGTFYNCIGGWMSFYNGTFYGCVGGAYSFWAGTGGVIVAHNCKGENGSFKNMSVSENSAFYNCKGENGSFQMLGKVTVVSHCTGGEDSFLISQAINQVTAIVSHCTGGDRSFKTTGSASATFHSCLGGNDSFAGKAQYYGCTGGDQSFPIVGGNSYFNCAGGSDSFRSTDSWPVNELSGTIDGCSGGPGSFAISTIALTGKLLNCDSVLRIEHIYGYMRNCRVGPDSTSGQRVVHDEARIVGCDFHGSIVPDGLEALLIEGNKNIFIERCTFRGYDGIVIQGGIEDARAAITHCIGGSLGIGGVFNEVNTPYNVFETIYN